MRSKAPCVDYGMGVQAGVGRLHHMSKMDLGRQAARQGLSKGLSEVGSGEDEVGLARNMFQPSDPLDWGVRSDPHDWVSDPLDRALCVIEKVRFWAPLAQ